MKKKAKTKTSKRYYTLETETGDLFLRNCLSKKELKENLAEYVSDEEVGYDSWIKYSYDALLAVAEELKNSELTLRITNKPLIGFL